MHFNFRGSKIPLYFNLGIMKKLQLLKIELKEVIKDLKEESKTLTSKDNLTIGEHYYLKGIEHSIEKLENITFLNDEQSKS